MNPPNYRKEVRQLIGLANYYQDTCVRLSHTFMHLTKITSSKVEFIWTKIEQDVFDETKRIMARYALSAYQYFNEVFKIHTNASAFQLGVVIRQKGKIIGFYSINILLIPRKVIH